MHWVDRGSEPDGLESMRTRYTPRWIRHYRDGKGTRPGDSRWREFRDDLYTSFRGLCAYCEEQSNEEVDHFRPVSKFPELVYQWSNWLLVCTACNRAKGAQWPKEGYVDPCTKSMDERPEAYFTFDTLTGSMLPRKGLSPERHVRAATMIKDLDLNGRSHLRRRMRIVEFLPLVEKIPDHEHRSRAFTKLSSRCWPLSSVVRSWLHENGYVPAEEGNVPPKHDLL
jgi:uncharacterized protein (TIGR02646 family)